MKHICETMKDYINDMINPQEKEPTFAMTEMELRASLFLAAAAATIYFSESRISENKDYAFNLMKIDEEIEQIIHAAKNRKRE